MDKIATNLSGERFGYVTVLCQVTNRANLWVCECHCGKRFKATRNGLLAGRVKTCGCSALRMVSQLVRAELEAKYNGRVAPFKVKKKGFDYGWKNKPKPKSDGNVTTK